MVKKFSKNNLNTKRGISTIVGGMIFLVLLTAGFSTFFLAMDVQSDTINAQLSVSDSVIEKTQEQFEIAVATDDSNNYQLGIQVKNKGPNPLEISDIWIVNKSDANQPAKKIAVNYGDAFLPPGYGSSILENQPLTMIPDDYEIKVISALGTIRKAELSVGGNNYLIAEMFTIPPDVRLNENVTVAMRITNIGPTTITGITPDNNPPINDNAAWILTSEFVSLSPIDLEPSESTIFSWQTKLSDLGAVGSKLMFTNLASGTESTTGFTVSSNTVSDKITVREDDAGGDGDLIVLTQDLLARPEIFALYPAPFGDSGNDKGIWGVNIVNPTNATMEISKVTISSFAPGAQNNDKIFETGGGGCLPETISPLPAVPHVPGWACISENQLLWKDLSNPQILPPYTSQSFLVKVKPGTISAAGLNLESVIVHANVFTTFGSFGKTDYASTMYDGDESIINVYPSSTSVVANLRNNNVINSTLSQIPSGSTQTFNMVLADMDNDGATHLKNGEKLIINVPKNWDNVIIDSVLSSGFTMAPPPIVDRHSDNSTQIIATTSQTIGNGGTDAAVLVFRADAPTVANDQMYVMYVLADGETNNNFAAGPLAEIILHVKKP
jgi:archaellum component FlaF (FlaF/FlaG flagellin family)